ncbi:type I restriction endonuclease subunit R [Dietzia psychralcaliphila]|uniref:type I restriction endonuclease subunit R n=1 Tax=Dietzia psychralcaliphila TaxID=139021 RepID=UPI001C1E6E03|nr:type I restriction endonuclease subunit R [Dietzia psychralcaliphila]
MSKVDENVVEQAAMSYFNDLGYEVVNGPVLAHDGTSSERADYGDAFLRERLRRSLARLNPDHLDLIDDAMAGIERAESQNPVAENYRVHRLLTEGAHVEYRDEDGGIRTTTIRFFDFDDPDNNDWLAVRQFTVDQNRVRRPDLVVFINGLPIAVGEWKNPTSEAASLKVAWQKIQSYRNDIPSLFLTNALTVLSDGTTASVSTFTANFEHYAPWKAIAGPEPVKGMPALKVLIYGAFDKTRLLDLIKNFIVFSDEGGGKIIKRIAKYHQFWAVNKAVESTVIASGPDGDQRGGVVWHTQGSGKSFEMLFYAVKTMRDPRMNNPTLVFLTDRNDLDDQLYEEVFGQAMILPERPVRADTRTELRELLRRASGGIIFTTLQKFAPTGGAESNSTLTDRRNVIVVADEAHRSQYGFLSRLTKDGRIRTGLAKHLRDALPGATFLGFTGTPIEATDKSTRAVFGDYIDVYDLTRAVEDGATVKIYYESRLAKVALSEDDLDALDILVDEITEGSDEELSRKTMSKWSRVEAVVGSEQRLDMVAADIVKHWERRRAEMLGKAMIVTMSRRIAVRLYEKIVALRPDWHSDDHEKGRVKVVMTGTSDDPPGYQPHVYDKQQRRDIKDRAKDPGSDLELVIVRDMWLTGFDSPSLHTMYVDRSLKGAGLMQAIARVNRTFRDKPGGLVVDYFGLFANLQEALREYSPSDRSQAGVPIEELVNVVLEKHDVIRGILHGCEYNSSPSLPSDGRLEEVSKVTDFVLEDEDRRTRFLDEVLALVKAFALAGSRDEVQSVADDIRMFTSARAAVLKIISPDSGAGGSGSPELDTAISQLVNQAVTGESVLDVYAMAGLENPELSLLSDEFLDSIEDRDRPHLQVGMLKKILEGNVKTLQRTNVVQSRKFSEMLDESINKYTNRSLTTAEVIAELVRLAKEMRDNNKRADELSMNEAEVAFYDAIIQNYAAVLELGDKKLQKISRDLVTQVRRSATIDWNVKESARAQMRTKVRRLLAVNGYPPDLEELAVDLVLEQAELFATIGME